MPASGTAPGLIFTDQQGGVTQAGGTLYSGGAEIMDEAGRPVWFWPVLNGYASDVRVQSYQGQPVLTWAQGPNYDVTTPGATLDFICDTSYHLIATVQAGNGLNADLHEFELTPQGTALIDCYNPLYDYTPGVTLIEGVIQEIDVATGQVLFEWHSAQHVSPSESYVQPSGGTFDYFHINSIRVDTDGNLIVSARHTWTVYKINRTTGDIIWRLGGKNSSFALGPGLPTAYQHHAVPLEDGSIRIFDNESDGVPVLPATRIVWVAHDDTAMTATLVRALQHPAGYSSAAEGSAQGFTNGDTLVGWGLLGGFSEFTAAGTLNLDVKQSPNYANYRVFRFPWTAQPTSPPVIHVVPSATPGLLAVDVIWNGATTVASWQVTGALSGGSAGVVAAVPWNGYDTTLTVPTGYSWLQAAALDASGNTLASSAVANAPFLAPSAPTFAQQPSSVSVSSGDTLVLSVGAPQPQTDYRWTFGGFPMPDGNWNGATVSGGGGPTLMIRNVTPNLTGSFACLASNASGEAMSQPAQVQVAAPGGNGRLVNLSTLGWTGTGADALTFGFVSGGAATGSVQPVLLRGSGPALTSLGVAGALPDPELDLYALGGSLLATDAGWQGSSVIANLAAAVGAFPWLNPESLDSALAPTLSSGGYTVEVTGASGDAGVVLAEVYDATPSGQYTAASPRLINASARALLGTAAGSPLLSAGFVIGGSTARTVLIRASGPALAAFGVTPVLADPALKVFSTGSVAPVPIASATGWTGDPVIASAAASVGAFAWPSTSADSAVLITLPPGNYSAQISSAGGNGSGVALAEVYEVR